MTPFAARPANNVVANLLRADYVIKKAAGLKAQNLFIGTTTFGQ